MFPIADTVLLRLPYRLYLTHACGAGRERLQSAGRARKHGSRFVEIVGVTASELALVHKLRREEEHLRTALQGLSL